MKMVVQKQLILILIVMKKVGDYPLVKDVIILLDEVRKELNK